MFVIGEISVHESVAATQFACDLVQCKGACCTFPGGRGAPLRDDEIGQLLSAFPAVESIIPEEHRAVIAEHGLFEGKPGNYATLCVDGKACVFVVYDDGIAKCSLEKAWIEKKTDWRKPLSCHLFPIRIGRDGEEIHFEYFSECAPALEKGKRENIGVHTFAAEPLKRAFGSEWVEQLNKEIGT